MVYYVDNAVGPRIRLSAGRVQGAFRRSVDELSGQRLYSCIQCGMCSSGCPMAEEMDLLPSCIMRLCQLGLEEEVLNCKTIWICASCFTCTTRCPKGIDIAAVMDALRQKALAAGVDHFGPDQIQPEQAAEVPQPGLVGVYRKLAT